MLLILVYLLLPAVIVVLCQRLSWLDRFGVVILSYGVGILLGSVFDLSAIFGEGIAAIQEEFISISIALALPLLLLSIDVAQWVRLAGDTIKAMCAVLVSVVAFSILGAWLMQGYLGDNVAETAGMLVGAYTGGGPNLAAVGTALEVDKELFVIMTSYDMIASSFYLIFLMTIAQRVFSTVLRPFPHEEMGESQASESDAMAASDESVDAYKGLVKKSLLKQTAMSFVVALAVLALAVGVSGLFPESLKITMIMLLLTTFGIAASFIPAVRNLANSFQLGMYLILAFCIAMGSMFDPALLLDLNYYLLMYIAMIMLGSLAVSLLVCKLLDIDVDTFLITSTAAIMSPPFVAVVAGALKNRHVILSGLAAGIMGYMLGNYLGIMVAYIVRWMLGAG